MRSLAAGALALVCACTPAWKATVGTRPDRPVRFSTFRSGLRLVVFQDPTPDRFDLAVVYGTGATSDPPGKEGLADLTRRLSQRSRGPGMERIDRLQAAGGVGWSTTDLDATAFRSRGPFHALDEALAVEAERLAHPVEGVGPEELEAAALEAGLDAPGPTAERPQLARLVEEVLAGHPYARPMLGSRASRQGIRLEDVQAFAAASLTAANAVVVVASGEDPELVARLVRDRLVAAGLPAAAVPAPPRAAVAPPPLPVPPAQPSLRTLRAGTAARLWLGWALPGNRSDETMAHALALGTLDQLVTSRLRQEDLAKRVRAVDVAALWGRDAAVAYARIDLRAAEDATAVLDAVAALLDSSATAAKVGDSAALVPTIARNLAALPDPDLTSVAEMVRAGYGADYVEALRTRLFVEAGRPSLERAARASFGTARMVRVLFLPREAEGGGEVLALPGLREHEAPGPGYRAPGAEAAARLVRAAAPAADELALPDGPRLLAVRRPGTGLVAARLVFPVPAEDGGGLGLLSLWAAARPLGCGDQGELDRDRVTFDSAGPALALDQVLSMVRCAAGVVRVHPASFLRGRDDLVKRAGARREPLERSNATVCDRALAPGGCPEALRVDELRRLTPADGDRWLSARLRPERGVLVLVGDLPPAAMLAELVKDRLGRWRGGGPPLPEAADAGPARRLALVVPVAGARDAWLQVVHRSPGFDDRAAVEALAEDLEAAMAPARTAMAFHQLVVEPVGRRGGWALLLTAGGTRGSVGPLLERLDALLRQAAAAPLPPERLDAARWEVARSFFFRRWSDYRLTEALARDQGAAGGPSPDPGASIGTLDAARLQEAARRLAATPPTAVVVGDPETLEPQLRLAGYQVEVLPAPEAGAPAAGARAP